MLLNSLNLNTVYELMIHNHNQPKGKMWVVKVALITVAKCSYLKKQVEIENNGPN